MAVTIHRDPFESLIRKIGYSVGLENTLERVEALARDYGVNGSMTIAQWKALVKEKWNLKSEHIADFFAELEFLRIRKTTLEVLPALDALGVLFGLLNEAEFSKACSYVLLYQIVVADGDVFINCLAAGFDKNRSKELLIDMIRQKRNIAYRAFPSPQLRDRVDRFITIETQGTNKGGSTVALGVSRLSRTEPLRVRSTPLESTAKSSAEISISSDYLRKVPARRRDWAISLGLFDAKDGITNVGSQFLAEIAAMGMKGESGAYNVWPLTTELPRLHLTPSGAPWHPVTSMDMMRLIRVGMGCKVVHPNLDESRFTDLIGELRDIFHRYKLLNSKKSMLRNELPMRVASLVLMARACARNLPSPALAELLHNESRDARRRIEFRSSKFNDGSLVVRAI